MNASNMPISIGIFGPAKTMYVRSKIKTIHRLVNRYLIVFVP